jgi:PKD repeat protein
MKSFIRSSIVLAVVAFATAALASPFGSTNLVIYRLAGNASGGQATALTNSGNIVWLDEYYTNGTFRQSHMMPTNYFGANSPLIDSGVAFGNGMITRSVDGRFILVTGFGATTNQFTTSLGSSYGTDAPRVIGLVDGAGNIDTTTTQTNRYVNGEQLRTACTPDGTNLWFGGDGYGGAGVSYTQVGSGVLTNLPTVTNIHEVNIFSNQLYFSSPNGSTNVSIVTNNVPGQLPESTNNVTVGGLAGVTNSINYWNFVLYKLNAGGTDPLDTLYVSDPTIVPATVWKFSLNSGTWQNVGSITAGAALGMATQLRISGGITNVDFWLTGGGATLTGGDYLYAATDSSGYGADPGGVSAFISIAEAANQTSFRGIAFAPSGTGITDDQPPDANLSVGPLLDFVTTANTGCSATQTFTYSIANLNNLAGNSMNWTVSSPQGWVNLSQSGGTLLPGQSTTLSVSLPGANGLSTGTNAAVITFVNTSNGAGNQTRAVQLVEKDQDVSPSTDFDPSGLTGGPFSPLSKVYTVYNGGNSAITLVVTNVPVANWLSFSATNIALGTCSSTNITVSLVTNAANPLVNGNYSSVITFSNATAQTVIDSDNAQLAVGGLFFTEDFSTFTQNTTLIPQDGWTSDGKDSLNEPYVTNGAVYVAAVGGEAADEPYRNIPLVSNCTLFAGMVMTVTSAPPFGTASPSRMVCFYNGESEGNYAIHYFSARDTGTGTYNVCARGNSFSGYTFGSTALNYNQSYRVILVGDSFCSNTWVYVNPTSPVQGNNTPEVFWTTTDTGGENALGSFSIQNAYGSLSGVIPGWAMNKLSINTNWAAVYNSITPLPATASFGAIPPTNGTAPLTVTFENLSSGTAPITNYWNYGDGTTYTNYTSVNVSHQYGVGTWSVSLIATNAVGGSRATSNNLITVTAAVAPTASFGPITPASGVAPLTVTFENLSSGTAPITNYWSYGDGATYTNYDSSSVSHQYGAGTWTAVSLTASNAVGYSTGTSNFPISVITPFQSWQNYYLPGGGPNAAGSADPSHDGVSNTNKFLSGFNPTNNASYAHIISIVKQGAGMNVTYLGANGDTTYSGGPVARTNVLEYTTGTATGNYSNNFTSTGVSTVLSNGTGFGVVTNMVDPNGASGANRYYHIRIIAP